MLRKNCELYIVITDRRSVLSGHQSTSALCTEHTSYRVCITDQGGKPVAKWNMSEDNALPSGFRWITTTKVEV